MLNLKKCNEGGFADIVGYTAFNDLRSPRLVEASFALLQTKKQTEGCLNNLMHQQ